MIEKIRSWPRWLRWGAIYSIPPFIVAILIPGEIYWVGAGFLAPITLLRANGIYLEYGSPAFITIPTLLGFLVGAILGGIVSTPNNKDRHPMEYAVPAVFLSLILYACLYFYVFVNTSF